MNLDEAKRRLCAALIGSAREGFSWTAARGAGCRVRRGQREGERRRDVNYSFRASAEAC